MNCLDITKHLSNIKDQIARFDHSISIRKPIEAINTMNELNNIFNTELAEFTDTFYRHPDQENYDKLVHKLIDKQSKGKPFTKKELIFIYEINYPLENDGGLTGDTRVKEIRDKLNHKKNAPIVLNCKPEEIFWNEGEEAIDIPSNAKAYIGPLFPDIFTKLQNIEHIYTNFPENRIRRSELTIGGRTEQQIEEELVQNGFIIADIAEYSMRDYMDFTTRSAPESIKLVRLRVSDLGFYNGEDTQIIYKQASKYGLEPCPPETAAYLRLQDKNQPINGEYGITMKNFYNSSSELEIFGLTHDSEGLWLETPWIKHLPYLRSYFELVFCLNSNQN